MMPPTNGLVEAEVVFLTLTLPEFEILKLSDDNYQLKINIKNIHTNVC